MQGRYASAISACKKIHMESKEDSQNTHTAMTHQFFSPFYKWDKVESVIMGNVFLSENAPWLLVLNWDFSFLNIPTIAL